MNCKTESYFLIMSSMVGRGLRTTVLDCSFTNEQVMIWDFQHLSSHEKQLNMYSSALSSGCL